MVQYKRRQDEDKTKTRRKQEQVRRKTASTISQFHFFDEGFSPMSNSNSGNARGRAYVATSSAILGVTHLDHLQSGQWMQSGKNKVRFVRQRGTGHTFIVSRVRKNPLNMGLFRLACGVQTDKVVTPIA